MQEIVVAA